METSFDNPKHSNNPGDYLSHNNFMAEREKVLASTSKKDKVAALREAYLSWCAVLKENFRADYVVPYSKLPSEYSEAKSLADKSLDSGFTRFFVSGADRDRMRTFAYALVGRLVARGKLHPSKVRFLGEDELINAMSGFSSTEALTEDLSGYSCIVVEDFCGHDDYKAWNLDKAMDYYNGLVLNDKVRYVFTISYAPRQEWERRLGSSSGWRSSLISEKIIDIDMARNSTESAKKDLEDLFG